MCSIMLRQKRKETDMKRRFGVEAFWRSHMCADRGDRVPRYLKTHEFLKEESVGML
jgi:hypothetical protein